MISHSCALQPCCTNICFSLCFCWDIPFACSTTCIWVCANSFFFTAVPETHPTLSLD